MIAEKTGYPTEMLDLDMAMDADLGIDSISASKFYRHCKSVCRKRRRSKPEHLGTLHNLRDIAAFLADAPPTPSEERKLPDLPPPRLHADRGDYFPRSPALERSIVSVRAARRSTTAADPYRGGGEIWLASDDSEMADRVEERLRRKGYRTRQASFALAARLATACFARRFDTPGAIGTNRRRPPKERPFRRQASRRGTAQRQAALFATVSRMDGAFGFGDLDPSATRWTAASPASPRRPAGNGRRFNAKPLTLAMIGLMRNKQPMR